MELFQAVFYGNTLRAWATALGAAVLTGLVLWAFKKLLRSRLDQLARRTSTDIDDLLVDVLDATRRFFFVAVAAAVGLRLLELPEKAGVLAQRLIVLLIFLQAALWGSRAIASATRRYAQKRTEADPSAVTTFTALSLVGRLMLWAFILILALDNLGVQITTLIAGLGIGGIAVALAAQSILGDLFASLSIVLDKPFVVGDFITVDQYLGTVEHVGLKTTRLRSLSGEELIFSNNDLLQSRVRNFKRMQERRAVFALGVVYQTSTAMLARIPDLIREIIDRQETARFDRAHFKGYGDSSLNFEVVYWVTDPDYTRFMDIQQAINLAIHETFAREGIEFAYPTRTILIEKESASG